MAAKRTRTNSEYEERNVSSFVESATTFKTNVTFFGAAEAASRGSTARYVLVIGTAGDLGDTGALIKALPDFPSADISDAVAAAKESKLYGTTIRTASGATHRLLVGVVPSEASRHNCAIRPDAISQLVKDAVGEAAAADLDVFVRVAVAASYELAIATAIARGANQPFSAKAGLAERGYRNPSVPVRVYFPNAALASKAGALTAAATSVQLAMFLVEAPTNLLDTTTLTEIAVAYAAQLPNVTVEVIAGEELREKGYGGIYGVGKAAEFPPALVSLVYTPPPAADGAAPRTVAWCGKGIVYDTGGLAIKTPVANMCGMKADCGGACALLCAFIAAVRSGATVRLACLLALADNAIGPRAQRNDDIVRLKSGRTIQINNSDAEGRLVLSDLVFHAATLLPFTPDTILDMATLTGAQMVATGKTIAATYCNTEDGERLIVAAGRASGDVVFPILYAPEFLRPEFATPIADAKNSVKDRSNALASCAGEFIRGSLPPSFKGHWIHVDMAGPAMRETATGFGVALVLGAFAAELFSV